MSSNKTLIYKQFKIDKYTGNRLTVADLAQVMWRGDRLHELQKFRNQWAEAVNSFSQDGAADKVGGAPGGEPGADDGA